MTTDFIAGSVVSPPLSDSLPDSQPVGVTASGYYTLQTSAGHLRAKGNMIYLIPTSYRQAYFDSLYFHPILHIYSLPIYQWAHNPVTIYPRGAFRSDAFAITEFQKAVALANEYISVADSELQFQFIGESTADFVIEYNPQFAADEPVRVAYAGGPPEKGTTTSGARFQGQIAVRDVESVGRRNLLIRALLQIAAPTVDTPGIGLLSRSDYEKFAVPTPDDFILVRIQSNRCGGTMFLTATLVENERAVTPCVIFPPLPRK